MGLESRLSGELHEGENRTLQDSQLLLPIWRTICKRESSKNKIYESGSKDHRKLFDPFWIPGTQYCVADRTAELYKR